MLTILRRFVCFVPGDESRGGLRLRAGAHSGLLEYEGPDMVDEPETDPQPDSSTLDKAESDFNPQPNPLAPKKKGQGTGATA
jgi:hypothetical protein